MEKLLSNLIGNSINILSQLFPNEKGYSKKQWKTAIKNGKLSKNSRIRKKQLKNRPSLPALLLSGMIAYSAYKFKKQKLQKGT